MALARDCHRHQSLWRHVIPSAEVALELVELVVGERAAHHPEGQDVTAQRSYGECAENDPIPMSTPGLLRFVPDKPPSVRLIGR